MGNWLSTSIRIGGTLKEADIDEFLEHVEKEGLNFDWGEDSGISEEKLRAWVNHDGTPEPLMLCGEANYGIYEDLEQWLDKHGLPYIRNNSSDGGDVESGFQVSTPEEGQFWVAANNGGEEMVPVAQIKEAVAALREGRIHDALDMFAKIKETPTLPPFKIEP